MHLDRENNCNMGFDLENYGHYIQDLTVSWQGN